MLPCSLKLTIIYILGSYWSSKKKKTVLQYKRVLKRNYANIYTHINLHTYSKFKPLVL